MPLNDARRIIAAREGGAVRRCHVAFPNVHHDVAQHCYGVVSILMILHPEPSLNLIKACLWHDVAERWTGDVPSTAKDCDEALRERLDALEHAINDALGFSFELSEVESLWLKFCDLLDLALWCRTQMLEDQNTRAQYWYGSIIDKVNDLAGCLGVKSVMFDLREEKPFMWDTFVDNLNKPSEKQRFRALLDK